MDIIFFERQIQIPVGKTTGTPMLQAGEKTRRQRFHRPDGKKLRLRQIDAAALTKDPVVTIIALAESINRQPQTQEPDPKTLQITFVAIVSLRPWVQWKIQRAGFAVGT